MALTAKQTAFCKEVANGRTGAEAYRIAFNNKSEGTSKVNASKLLKTPEIALKIQELIETARKITEASQKEVIDTLVNFDIMSRAERMQTLTDIARGKIQLQKPMVCDGQIELIDVVPAWSDRRDAIAELNKMDGEYSAIKKEIKINKVGLDALEDEYVD